MIFHTLQLAIALKFRAMTAKTTQFYTLNPNQLKNIKAKIRNTLKLVISYMFEVSRISKVIRFHACIKVKASKYRTAMNYLSMQNPQIKKQIL